MPDKPFGRPPKAEEDKYIKRFIYLPPEDNTAVNDYLYNHPFQPTFSKLARIALLEYIKNHPLG